VFGLIGHACSQSKGEARGQSQLLAAIHAGGRGPEADSATPRTGGDCGNRPPSQRSGWIPCSRCFGVTDFACTWLAHTQRILGCGKPRGRTWPAQTKLSEESGKPEESEVWRRRESDLTRFSETGLFLHFRRKSSPRNTRVPLNTRSIAPSQPQRRSPTLRQQRGRRAPHRQLRGGRDPQRAPHRGRPLSAPRPLAVRRRCR
jgi:hypothetical protein